MRTRKSRIFVGDFETTVFDGQTDTLVWASACVELFSEDVAIFHSIDDTYEFLIGLNTNVIIYYHNLKFDGSFWVDFLLTKLHLEQAYTNDGDDTSGIKWINNRDMPNDSFMYVISQMGQWYTIKIKHGTHIIEIRDSLKLLPFAVKKIGESFGTKHKKLDMEYTGFRYPGCEITDEEKRYISNDVLVIKEALEIMYSEGHTSLTIGSCCLTEYKRIIGRNNYTSMFPNLYEVPICAEIYGAPNAGEYVRRSYRGGWCYVVKGKENRMFHNGTTADVNSLYPSMMSSESGNFFPVGMPTFWSGNFIPDEAQQPAHFYFIRFRTRFYLRNNKLPFIQIKNTRLYRGTEMLETSDILNSADGCYYDTYIDFDGNERPAVVTLTMTQTDFALFLKHYAVQDFEILDGCYFDARIGIFDDYIERYKRIKLETTGAKRQLAKLFLNNLYGKMAASTDSSFKVAYIGEDGEVRFFNSVANDKTPGYIPVGSAITSYARCFTIRAAQLNYHGVNSRGFIYADTDSIHCDLLPDELVGIREDPKAFCCWKLEGCWDEGWFVRQKTYAEHITHEDRQPVDTPYYSLKCAGMPERCKDLFLKSMSGYVPTADDKFTPDELDFLQTRRTITDFRLGLKVPGKLIPKRIRGGVLLVPTTYEMR
ncbi:MAG: hypothetical protein J6Q48_07420 [Bacteroidaceae bacterium]|nr:hypothetical protein [Bacteroidaceae bacterium]